MSLIQPTGDILQKQETSMEQQLLQEVRSSLQEATKGINDLKNGQSLLNTKLFGDPNSENDGGRLPRVEFLAAQNASVIRDLQEAVQSKVIRNGPERIEALERGQIREGPERMENLEKGQAKFAVITGLASVFGSAILTVVLKLVFHV